MFKTDRIHYDFLLNPLLGKFKVTFVLQKQNGSSGDSKKLEEKTAKRRKSGTIRLMLRYKSELSFQQIPKKFPDDSTE